MEGKEVARLQDTINRACTAARAVLTAAFGVVGVYAALWMLCVMLG